MRLLGRNHGGAVGVLDPLNHLAASEHPNQGLELLADGDDGTYNLPASLHRVVGVDDSQANVG